MFFLRRLLLGVFIIFIDPDGWLTTKLTWLCVTQLVQTSYLIIIRPFVSSKDNLSEIINEVTFMSLCLPLFIFREESDWIGGSEGVLLGIIMTNQVVFMFISIGKWLLATHCFSSFSMFHSSKNLLEEKATKGRD